MRFAVATALHHGLPSIISPDHAFDAVAGLGRVDPAGATGAAER